MTFAPGQRSLRAAPQPIGKSVSLAGTEEKRAALRRLD